MLILWPGFCIQAHAPIDLVSTVSGADCVGRPRSWRVEYPVWIQYQLTHRLQLAQPAQILLGGETSYKPSTSKLPDLTAKCGMFELKKKKKKKKKLN